MVTHKKTQSYIEQSLGNDSIPFTIETYGCFHSYFDSLLTAYA